eukprot:jgi/Botrbrau1/21788/Bobra.0190s0015.1
MGRPIVLTLLIISLFAGSCLSESVETDTAPEPAAPTSAPGVETYYWFPKYGASLAFPAGDVVEVVAGFHNGFNTLLNVTNITGSIGQLDGRGWAYNFSAQNQWMSAPPGQDISLSYQFLVDKALPALKFQVALSVWYQSETTQFVTTFFNETVTVVEKSVLIDTEQIFMWLIIAGLLALPLWAGYRYLKSLAFFKKATKRAPAPRAAPSEANTNEWLAGTYFNQQSKLKASKTKASGTKHLKAKAG